VCVTQAGSLAQNCGVTSLLDMADLLGCDPSPEQRGRNERRHGVMRRATYTVMLLLAGLPLLCSVALSQTPQLRVLGDDEMSRVQGCGSGFWQGECLANFPCKYCENDHITSATPVHDCDGGPGMACMLARQTVWCVAKYWDNADCTGGFQWLGYWGDECVP
jgi:hypothetical protein